MIRFPFTTDLAVRRRADAPICAIAGAWGGDHVQRDIVVATMRYAKRQRTWFRHQETATWFADADQAFDAALRWLDAPNGI